MDICFAGAGWTSRRFSEKFQENEKEKGHPDGWPFSLTDTSRLTNHCVFPLQTLTLLSVMMKRLVEHALTLAPGLTTNVNEQNAQAVGFYKKMGFKVTGRSEVDDLGKPYPLLNLIYQ